MYLRRRFKMDWPQIHRQSVAFNASQLRDNLPISIRLSEKKTHIFHFRISAESRSFSFARNSEVLLCWLIWQFSSSDLLNSFYSGHQRFTLCNLHLVFSFIQSKYLVPASTNNEGRLSENIDLECRIVEPHGGGRLRGERRIYDIWMEV